MYFKELVAVGTITLILTQTAFADGVAQAVDGLESDVGTLESDVGTLQSDVSALDSDVSTLEGQVALLQTENAQLQAVITSLTAVVDGLAAQQADLVALQRCHSDAGSNGRRWVDGWIGGVDWHGCDKRGIGLWGPIVGGDEDDGLLVNADLRGTDFTDASIIGVYINGSDLEGANFTNANLAYSDLNGANIVTWQQAQDYAHLGLQETIFSNTTCPDETNSDDNGGTCANNRSR